MCLNIVVLLGSVRSDRKGLRVARYVERQFNERGHCVTLVDPQALQLPLLDRMYKEYPKGTAPETLPAIRRDETGAVTRSRPLCQYPLVARYRGTGSTDDARNFVCGPGS